jgi:hypothetical protein
MEILYWLACGAIVAAGFGLWYGLDKSVQDQDEGPGDLVLGLFVITVLGPISLAIAAFAALIAVVVAIAEGVPELIDIVAERRAARNAAWRSF